MALPIAQRRARNTTLAGAPWEFEDIYDQMDLQLNERELVVSGETTERQGGRLRRRGRFEYRVYLPGDIDADGVRAELSEGILTVVVPKSATEKNHHIEIAN